VILNDDIRAALLAATIACQKKEPEDLSEFERVAIAFMAGCKIRTREENGLLRLTTENPIGITKIKGKFLVAERKLNS